MTAGSPQRPGAEAFTAPGQVNQRRYEAIRAWYVEALTYQQAADPLRLHAVGDDRPGPPVAGREAGPVRPAPQTRPGAGHRAGQGPGPRPGHRAAPTGTVQLRDLRPTGHGTDPAEPHLGRRDPVRGGLRPAAAPPRTRGQHQPGHPGPGHQPARRPGPGLRRLAGRVDSTRAGLLLVLPDLAALDLPDLTRRGRLPRHPGHPRPVSWLLTLLGLKLTRTRRVSHVDDLLADPAAALLAGMAVLPKKSALTSYSYRLAHDHQQRFLAALDTTMIDQRAGQQRRGDLRPGLPRRHALGHRPRPGKALRANPFATRPVRADLLRAGHRHAQPGLRQRRHLQGHPGPRSHRVLRPLDAPPAEKTRPC